MNLKYLVIIGLSADFDLSGGFKKMTASLAEVIVQLPKKDNPEVKVSAQGVQVCVMFAESINEAVSSRHMVGQVDYPEGSSWTHWNTEVGRHYIADALKDNDIAVIIVQDKKFHFPLPYSFHYSMISNEAEVLQIEEMFA